METVNQWKDMIFNSLGDMSSKVATVIPNIVGALFIYIWMDFYNNYTLSVKKDS